MLANSDSITRILQQAGNGDRTRLNELMPLVYQQLHELANRQFHHESNAHTLNATSLAHEAYLKMVQAEHLQLKDRHHFFALAARAMRRILIDYARARKSQKRGAEIISLTIDSRQPVQQLRADDLLNLNDALERLNDRSPRQSKVIEYWFFGGMTHQEIAELLEVSYATVRRDWRLARAWLSKELKEDYL